jgi:hypothetical protein
MDKAIAAAKRGAVAAVATGRSMHYHRLHGEHAPDGDDPSEHPDQA